MSGMMGKMDKEVLLNALRLIVIGTYQIALIVWISIVISYQMGKKKSIDNIKMIFHSNMSMMCRFFYHELAHIYRGHFSPL